jgi:hypothetical protein
MSRNQQQSTVIRGSLGILLVVALAVTAVKCADETPNRGLRQDGRVSTGPRVGGATHPSGSQGGHFGGRVPVINLPCQTCGGGGDPPPPTPTPEPCGHTRTGAGGPPTPDVPCGGGCRPGYVCGAG